MTNERKDKGISAAARAVGCGENQMRVLDRKGIVKPIRDSAGRRLFSQEDILDVGVLPASAAGNSLEVTPLDNM
jgi:DNA-binding transcriptional MerR regulator